MGNHSKEILRTLIGPTELGKLSHNTIAVTTFMTPLHLMGRSLLPPQVS